MCLELLSQTPIPGLIPHAVDFPALLHSLRRKDDIGLNWIANRIEMNMHSWEAIKSHPKRPIKILIFLGLLHENSDMKIRHGLDKGKGYHFEIVIS